MKSIRAITLAVNLSKTGANKAAENISEISKKQGCNVRILEEYPLPKGSLENQDLCCSIGGDGTLLGVLDAALESNTAVLGINMGKLGFLSTFNEHKASQELPSLIQGNYSIAKRSVLSCKNAQGRIVHGLNDVVIKEPQGNGLVRLCVSADNEPVSEYYCDGLVFSTPTGSTAYNLSAGGPIIGPTVKAIAMTPICPHTFGNRAVIFDESTSIKVESSASNVSPRITIDGRPRFENTGNFPIEITISEKSLRIMQNPNHAHFTIVRDKFNWSGSIIR